METVFYDCFIQSDEDADKISNVFLSIYLSNPDISFTMKTYYYKQMPFLDVVVSDNNTIFNTDTYYKPTTDVRQYPYFDILWFFK